ncbi:MAG TPA: GNAT family N-acetyltransferase [Thermoleophilaceae bacterium]|jgi:GNAT superfamily N-acetyltransferase
MLIRFESVGAEDEPARALLQAMRDEIAELYDNLDLDSPKMPRAGPAELGPPGGDFVVGFDSDGAAVCCGGIKALPDGACEIKRLYVEPELRGRGLARQLLEELERRAGGLGYSVVRLDTGPRQPHSETLFLSAGYSPIHNFNGNPMASFFGEKRI